MNNLITLDQVRVEKKVKVVEIHGGWGSRQRLSHLGIHVDDNLIVKRSGIMGGPILIQIHGSEVALGRGMARKVIVLEQE